MVKTANCSYTLFVQSTGLDLIVKQNFHVSLHFFYVFVSMLLQLYLMHVYFYAIFRLIFAYEGFQKYSRFSL